MANTRNKTHLGPKSKTEKKIDNNIRLALTDVCEQLLKDIPGFIWLTHQANYTNFPASLLITCVFDTEAEKEHAHNNGYKVQIEKYIQSKLLKVGVKFKAISKQIVLDSEEACTHYQEGNWAERLQQQDGRAVPKNRPH